MANYLSTWKQAKILAILKPGKPANDSASCGPNSVFCCFFKIQERILLSRLSPYLEYHLPTEQAGFRPGRNTTEQVLTLASYIESGYEIRETIRDVFVDLSAAYNTVWRNSLKYKPDKVATCRKTLKLLKKW